MFEFNLRNYGFFELFLCMLLNAIGLIFIRSSLTGSMYSFISQFLISILSLIFCILISFLNLKRVFQRYFIFFWLTILVLFSVYLIGIAWGRNSMRWVDIPIIHVKLQPSEFAKLFEILFLSKYIEKMDVKINRFENLMKVVGFFIVPFLMILLQPNLSSSLIMLVIFLSLLFSSKLDSRWFIFGGLAFILLFGTIYLSAKNGWIYNLPLLKDYQKQRIVSFFNHDADDQGTFQQENSAIAIGSGRLTGKGINNDSTQSVKNGNWLAEEQNDFIFAVVGEEVGFLGSSLIILLYMLLVARCFLISNKQREMYKKLICVGVGSWIGFQSFVNMGVATSLIPNTGVPLPFFSQGGSALLSIYMGMGFVINIKRDIRG